MPDTTAENTAPIQYIRARSGLLSINLREMWMYRELFWFMAWRDILVRYKQSALGILWAVLRPLLTMIVFTVIFGSLAGLDKTTAVPYAILTTAAVLPWQFFATSVSSSSMSLISSAHIISKIYFPRLIMPISAVVSNVVDFVISLFILIALMAYYMFRGELVIHPQIVLLPLFFAVAAMAALGCGLWLSSLSVKYRDVKHVVPFIVQMGMYISPVGYMTSTVPEKWRFLYSLNPMVGTIDGFRWCILGSEFQPDWSAFAIGCSVVVVVLISGTYFFRSSERSFADLI